MNDIGVNVAQVLDDLQCSYMNNSEYVRMSRIEEYNNSPKQGKFDLTKVLKDQGSDSRGFDDIWGGGIKMNWTLVPVEQQKPHINWRQAIDDDGSRLGRLASWMDINSGMTAAIVNATNNESKINVYLKNQKAMDENKNNEEYKQYIIEGREHTENTVDLARTDYENYEDKIKEAIGSSIDLDVLAVLSAAVAEQNTTDYKMVVDTYRQCAQTIGSDNPALVWTAVGTNTTIVKKYVDGKLDTYLNEGQGNGTVNSKPEETQGTKIPEPNIVEHNWGITSDILSNITTIAIHHAGGEMTVEQVHNLHKNSNGWSGIGYHFYIHNDGTIHRGRPENIVGAHAQGHNNYSLGISLCGNLNERQPTDQQWQSLVSLVAYLCEKYAIAPSRSTIKGHRDFSGHESNDCPGNMMYAKLDELVQIVASGNATGTFKSVIESKLWVDFVEKIKKGVEKEGKSSTAGLNLFPKICYMYVKLMNDIKNSSFDGDSGWGFPYTDDIIQQTPEKCVFLTGHCGETSGHAGKHEGIDIQPSGVTENRSANVPFCAVKDGVAYTEGQWCNGIYVKHDDGTWARFLHCRSRSVSNGQRVQRGQQIGITGGHDGSSDDAYPVHLHVEFGEQRGKAPYEKVYDDDCLIDPEDCWRKPNGTDSVSGKPMWTL